MPVTRADQLFDLSGEVALVTGASSGLGRRFAQVLAAHGAAVGLAARRADRLQELAAEIAAQGGRAVAVPCDVTDQVSLRAAFDALEAAAGPATILVNNAGIAHSDRALDLDSETWRAVIATNLDAVFFAAQEAALRMAAGGRGGAIVNLASVLALRPDKGVAAYAASKAAVAQLTRVLALEWARHNIRVNALAPGWFRTDMNSAFLDSEPGAALTERIPLRRFGADGDLDGALLLLASRAGAYLTGSLILVDGGHALAS